jgi:hypothetical protein
MRPRGVPRTIAVARIVAALLALAPVAMSSPPAAVAAPISPKPGVVDGRVWHLRNSLSTGMTNLRFTYGRPGDFAVMGDWDGNGSATAGALRVAPDGVHFLWLLRNTNSAGPADITVMYGIADHRAVSVYDVPIVGDWDGNGTDTPGVVRVRPQEMTFLLRNSSTSGAAEISFRYGRSGFPVVGDWDGDGTDTPGVTVASLGEPGQKFWYLRNSNSAGPAEISLVYGNGADIVISDDWDGDGKDTPGVVRRSPTPPGTRWLLRNSTTSGVADVRFDYGTNSGAVVVVWR